MIYYTHCRDMASPHYVCAGVSWDASSVWMIYYRHHRRMASHHYVCADVSQEDPSE